MSSLLTFLIISSSCATSLNAEETKRYQVGIYMNFWSQHIVSSFSPIDILIRKCFTPSNYILLLQILSFGGNGNIGSAVLSRLLDTMEADVTVSSR